jgi:DnaJ-domain-containing protein 1
MFDRLFNILKANLNSALDKEYVGDKTVDEIYAEYLKKMKEESQQSYTQETPPNYQYQSYQQAPKQEPPKPQYSQEELEAWKALELPPNSPFDQVKASYKTLIKKYHPDKFATEPSKYKTALEISQKLNKAYDFLEKKYGK